MDYKGYNIAVHELGHNVEQMFSLYDIDSHAAAGRAEHRLHRGARVRVPGARPRAARPAPSPTRESRARCETLNDFWGTYEIAGVALVDIAVWHWMYDHPERHARASCASATVQIAKDVWNQYYAPVFGKQDVVAPRHLLAHDRLLPLPARLPARPPDRVPDRGADARRPATLGAEFERMAKAGSVAPDLWMKHATGAPVGAQALLAATEKALTVVR